MKRLMSISGMECQNNNNGNNMKQKSGQHQTPLPTAKTTNTTATPMNMLQQQKIQQKQQQIRRSTQSSISLSTSSSTPSSSSSSASTVAGTSSSSSSASTVAATSSSSSSSSSSSRRRRSSLTALLQKTKNAASRHSSKQNSKDDNSKLEEEEIDPVYLLIKQAKELYGTKKDRKPPGQQSTSHNNLRSLSAGRNKQDQVFRPGSSQPDLRRRDVTGSGSSLAVSSNHRISEGNSGNNNNNNNHNSNQTLRVTNNPNNGPTTSHHQQQQKQKPGTSEEYIRPEVRVRAPHLDLRMKSLSLDSPDATPYTLNLAKTKGHLNGGGRNGSPNKNRLSAPRLIKNCSIETDETDYTSASGSPCPSPYEGSLQSLSMNEKFTWVATREYKQRFPEDLGLNCGDKITIVDTSDPEWYHGYKESDPSHVGIFPVTCVAKMHVGERIIQVTQNITLSHPPRHLRLYRDQIVFGHGEITDEKAVAIRTEKNYKATCPAQYLKFLRHH